MAFCIKCGAQLADGAFFCANCGAPLQQQQPPVPPAAAPAEPQQPPVEQPKAAPAEPQQPPVQQPQQPQTARVQPPQQAPDQQYGQAPNQQSFFAGIINTPDHTAEMHPNDIAQNKVMGIFAYLGPLVLIPIFAAKQSRFARFHANQGLLVDIAVSVICIFMWLFLFIFWPLGVLFLLLYIPVTALQVLGIINAIRGKAKELPFIGKIKLLN